MEKAEMIFITGGVRSGKSAFAEGLATSLCKGDEFNLHYIACGMASDEEMKLRIRKHQLSRDTGETRWTTWEQPSHLSEIASHFTQSDVLVLDCVTTLLNNYLFLRKADGDTAAASILRDIASLRETCGKLVIVSNELFHGIPAEDELTDMYQHMLGTIHQHIVKNADQAYLIEHGIRVLKKGGLA